MSNEKSLNINKFFLGKKCKFSNETTTKDENNKNEDKIYNNISNLNKPISDSRYFKNKLIQQDLNLKERENEIFQCRFCFICGNIVEDDEYKYLINPLQKFYLINKLSLILPKNIEEKLLIEEQNFSEIRLCKKCHLYYFKILKPFLKQECENNMKAKKESQFENPIRKGINLPEICTNNNSNENKVLQLLNNDIKNNLDIKLNNSNKGINDKRIFDNNNNYFYEMNNILKKLKENNNANIINNDINKNEKMTDINRNYMTFINSLYNKELNSEINYNNFHPKITNLNDILFNLNNSFTSNNNLNFFPQFPSFIQNSSNNNINQLNNINISQNLNQGFLKKLSKDNNIISNKNENDNLSSNLNFLDNLQKLNAKIMKQKNILINNNNNAINYNENFDDFLQIITNCLDKYRNINKKFQSSLINDIESLMDIFFQILPEIIQKNIIDKLNGDIDKNSENKKKGEKIDEDKCFLKENSEANNEEYFNLKNTILKAKENINCELNAIKIYDEAKDEFILTLLKNLKNQFNLSQNTIQNKNNDLLNEINTKLKQPNNENNSNSQFNVFSKEIMDNLYNNLFQMNKIKNNQEPLLSQINQKNISFNLNQSYNIPNLLYKNDN